MLGASIHSFPPGTLRSIIYPVLSLVIAIAIGISGGQPQASEGGRAKPSYLGFDKNLFPGDAALDSLRKTFAFSGYWLNAPPGAVSSTWLGKRRLLRAKGFGFLLLFNGRTHA